MADKLAGLRLLRGERSVVEEPAPASCSSASSRCSGDVRKGRRPTVGGGRAGPVAEPLVDALAGALRERGVAHVPTGSFGADMRVGLVNDGPVTLVVDTP